MATKNLYASLFGESPETQQARETRNQSFQDMLSSRRQAAEQNRTDNVQMARYNALGNVLTTMVQPLGWAAGGSTAGVQKYDDRQYIDAFNRALKAQDDLRNIGNAEAEYNFKLAEQDYNRLQSLEDAERQQQRMIERQELAEQGRMERDQKKHEMEMEKQRENLEYKRWADEFRAANKVTSKRTGLSIQDKILLQEVKDYNTHVNNMSKAGKPYETFDEWMAKKGYQVDKLRPATVKPTRPAGGSGSSSSNSSSGKSIDW